MTRSVRIVPAILTDNSSELTRLIMLANRFAPFVQIDLMDGMFTDSRSISVNELAAAEIAFQWEAHLMVCNPMAYLEPLHAAGASRVIFHLESDADPHEIALAARSLGLSVGIAINPPTPVSELQPFLDTMDSVLLMTVNPGYYGAPFIPGVMRKAGQVRALRSNIEIAVDGGIKEVNLLEVVRYGVDTVCVGSAVFASPDPEASYQRLSALVH